MSGMGKGNESAVMTRVAAEEDPMVTLCRAMMEIDYDDLPDELIEYAKKHIVDQLVITMAGSSQEGIQAVVDFVNEQGGSPQSAIPFLGGKVTAPMAGMAIGPMARALDLGDVNPEGNAHTAEYTLPTLLGALGLLDKVSGRDFITAFVAAQEVLVRIGAGAQPSRHPGGLFDQGGFYIFGCVVGVARLIGLSFEQTMNALGMAKAMTQPHDMMMYTPATLMARVHHGFVAQDAITCCLLARKGITGPKAILAGPGGFFRSLTKGTWEAMPEAVTRDLGQDWVCIRTMFKPFTACKFTHSGMTAMIELMDEHEFCPADIAGIHGAMLPSEVSVICVPADVKWNPQTVPDAQFSFPYTVATAAFQKKFFIKELDEETRARRDIRDLMQKVTASEDPGLPPFVTRLTVTLNDGRELTRTCAVIKGFPEMPFTWEDIRERAKAAAPYCAFDIDREALDLMIEKGRHLEAVEDVARDLVSLITP